MSGHLFDRENSHLLLPIKCQEKLISMTLWIIKYGFHSISCYYFDRKSIFLRKISMWCHSQAFLWDVHFGRHFISQHAQDDKQKLTREGMGNLYQTSQAIQLKLETSRITFKNAWLPLLFIWSYESVVPIEHMIYFDPGEKIIQIRF